MHTQLMFGIPEIRGCTLHGAGPILLTHVAGRSPSRDTAPGTASADQSAPVPPTPSAPKQQRRRRAPRMRWEQIATAIGLVVIGAFLFGGGGLMVHQQMQRNSAGILAWAALWQQVIPLPRPSARPEAAFSLVPAAHAESVEGARAAERQERNEIREDVVYRMGQKPYHSCRRIFGRDKKFLEDRLSWCHQLVLEMVQADLKSDPSLKCNSLRLHRRDSVRACKKILQAQRQDQQRHG